MSNFYKEVKEKFFKEFNPKGYKLNYLNKSKTRNNLNAYIADIVIQNRESISSSSDSEKVKEFLYIKDGSEEDNYFYNVLCGNKKHLKKNEIISFTSQTQIKKLYNLPISVNNKDFNKKQRDACGFFLGYLGKKEYEFIKLQSNEIKKELTDNSESIQHSKKNNLKSGFLEFIISFIIFFPLGFFGGPYISNNFFNKEKTTVPIREIRGLFQSKEGKTFKVLLLPFKDDKECREERTDYISQVIERYKEIGRKNDLNIDIQYFKNIDSLYTPTDVATILNNSNINLVIWGMYRDECEEDSRVVINHAPKALFSSKEFPFQDLSLDIKGEFFGSSGLKKIDSVEKIREGILLEEVDSFIFSVITYLFTEQERYDEVEKIITQLDNEKKLNSHLRNTGSLVAIHKGKYDLAERYAKEVICKELLGQQFNEGENIDFFKIYTKYRDKIIENKLMIYSWILLAASIKKQDIKNPLWYKILYNVDKDTPDGFLDLEWTKDQYCYLVGLVLPTDFDNWHEIEIEESSSWKDAIFYIEDGDVKNSKMDLVHKKTTIKFRNEIIHEEYEYPKE